MATKTQMLQSCLHNTVANAQVAIALRDRRIKELEAHTPTPDAYDAACRALAHWRKEAKRLGRIAGVAPREMKHRKQGAALD